MRAKFRTLVNGNLTCEASTSLESALSKLKAWYNSEYAEYEKEETFYGSVKVAELGRGGVIKKVYEYNPATGKVA